ncbi:MAG: TrbG/VirB9 family P-type conjugative transfer protein [Rickettsiales bacterium]
MSKNLKNNRSIALSAFFWALASFVAGTAATPCALAYSAAENVTVAVDSRIKTFVYNPNEVYRVNFQFGYQSYVEFAKYEKIETISIGNPFSWKISPSDNRVFIKPLEGAGRTNMTVFTNHHTYQFEIQSAPPSNDEPDEKLAFVVRFFYPSENYDVPPKSVDRASLLPSDTIRPLLYNFDYTLAGPDSIAPVEVFDDGNRTYMKFPANNAVVPVIFMKEPSGALQKAPYTREGPYVVVTALANEFQLRMGADMVQVFNEKFSARQW